MRGWRCGLPVLVLTAAVRAQDVQLAGTVHDDAGAPVAGATVAFEALPVLARPTPGARGRYTLAQAAQRTRTSLPKTRTDRSGTWRIVLSPQQAALTDGSGVELALRVTAEGCGTWLRGIGTRIAAANGIDAVLPRARGDGARLRVRIEPAVQGYALVERVYRARGDASLWLPTIVELGADGAFTFDEPPRVPGETPATLPTARAEGYRVTIFAAGCERWQRTLAEGAHTIPLEVSADPPRRVLAQRGEPAATPITASYRVAGTEVTLSFGDPRVPLLGGELPTRVRSASGPVLVDAWDPDAALFVDAAAEPAPAPAAGSTPVAAGATATFAVADREGQGLFGAVIWLEDSGARTMSLDPPPFAITDALGRARLTGLPTGVFRALVRHATGGELEVLVDSSSTTPIEVELAPTPAPPEPEAPRATTASILLDLDASKAEGSQRVEVGVQYAPGRVLMRSFPDHPGFVRIEGLPPGPMPIFARIADGPVHLLGAVLASADDRPAVRPFAAPAKTFVVKVRAAEGVLEPEVYLSLGDAAPRGRKPYTTALLPVTYDKETGEARLTLHTAGDVWVMVHGADGRGVDLLLPDVPGEPLPVTLPPPPPAPASDAEKKRDG